MEYNAYLTELESQGNLRQIPSISQQKDVIDFSLNDYLGIAERGVIQQSFFNQPSNSTISLTSSASRLLAANQKEYDKLEAFLRDCYHKDALIFNSGYHANVGVVSALADKDTLIVADKLVHASIIDGIALSKAPFTRFRHNDTAHLSKILEKEASKYSRILIIVESVYSMDGDQAPLQDIIELKRLYPHALLYVDEAHAVGAAGIKGLGICSCLANTDDVDIIIGTCGKALASSGAFAIINTQLRSVIINRARSLIFSTSLPPICCAYTRFVMEHIIAMNHERDHLRKLAAQLRTGLHNLGMATYDDDRYIAPVVIGDARRTVELSKKLLDYGVKVLPIRTPTVPPGTERLRISLSAAMSTEHVDRLINALSATL